MSDATSQAPSGHFRYDGPVVDGHLHFDLPARHLVDRILRQSQVEACINLWDVAWPPSPFSRFSTEWRGFHPRMRLCHVPDLSRVGERGWASQAVADVRAANALGAVGLKVWKNLGLWLTDVDGRRVKVNDRRLDPLWACAAELGLPIVIHVGDEQAFFEPLTPENPRYQELSEHPEWWYGDGSFPSLREIHDQFEQVVAEHRDTVFVGAHFGCFLPWLEVDRFFDSYPNFFVDTSARVAEMGHENAVGVVREIFERHPDRIIFGSDLIRIEQFDMPNDSPDRGEVTSFYSRHWAFFETGKRDIDLPFSFQGDWKATGLDLPAKVLRAIYSENSRRLFRLDSGQRAL